MDEDWDDSGPSATNAKNFDNDGGRSFGKGRGFTSDNTRDGDEWNPGPKSYGGAPGEDDHRGGRGGGRGGRGRGGARGGGGGGGFRRNDNDEHSEGRGYEGEDNNDDRPRRGGGGGGGRGAYRSRDDDGEGGNYRSRDNGEGGGGYKSRGDYDNGYKSRGNDDNGYKSRGNDDNEDGGGWNGGRGRGRGRGGGRGGGRDGGRDGGRGDDEGFGSGGGGRDEENDDKKGDDKPKENYVPPEPSNDDNEIFGGGVQAGINFDKYDNIKVKITGENIPMSISSFDEAGLRDLILTNVKKSGYKKPTPVQKHALPIIASGRDLMACAQTGSGKTAAFLLPIISKLLEKPREFEDTSSSCRPRVVIMSPTRELAIQIFEEARKFSRDAIVKPVVIYGGTSMSHQIRQVQSGVDILVATPGRLNDFVERGKITFDAVEFFILDEADRMLDLGFLKDIERVIDHESMTPSNNRQTLMFSATFPSEIQVLAGKFLKDYIFLAVGIIGGACSDIEQNFYEVARTTKRPKLKELVENEAANGNLKGILVFVEMKRTADYIATFLCENRFPSTSIHGDRLQREREEALSDFKRGNMPIMVATPVAARGLDIKNVTHVINYDLPKSIDEYVHRIGRTGRVGNKGKATSFYDPNEDSALSGELVRILNETGQNVPDWLQSGGSGGSSFSTGRSSGYGGRDVRKFADSNNGDNSQGVSSSAAETDEAW